MPKIRRIDIEHSGKVFEKMRPFRDKLYKTYKVTKAIVFGSFARKDINEGSDVDLMVVADFKEDFKERTGKVMALTKLPIEPVCYTPEEFKKMKKNRNPFILAVLKEGIPLSKMCS